MPEQLKLYFENMERLAENDQTYMEEKVGNDPGKRNRDRRDLKWHFQRLEDDPHESCGSDNPPSGCL